MKKHATVPNTDPRAAGSTTSGATRKLAVLALLSAIGFVAMMWIKIPAVSFLKYEPKDIFITFAGFLYGPLAALACAAVTGFLELPFSSTGLIGMVMNILSSAAFACTASFVYQKRRDIIGAVTGLLCSVVCMTTAMLLWNYLISPLYMGISRAAIVPMLTSVFLPFNLLKAGLNAALTLLLYRSFIRVLQLCGYSVSDRTVSKRTSTVLITVTAAILFTVCAFVIWYLNRG